jgi:hypothetical protein
MPAILGTLYQGVYRLNGRTAPGSMVAAACGAPFLLISSIAI